MDNVIRCENCGTQQVFGAQFCAVCGQSLGGLSTPAVLQDTSTRIRKLIVRRIGILSYVKVSTAFAAIFVAPLFLIGLIVLVVLGQGEGLGWAIGLGMVYILGYALILIITTCVLNLALRLVGGLEIEVSD